MSTWIAKRTANGVYEVESHGRTFEIRVEPPSTLTRLEQRILATLGEPATHAKPRYELRTATHDHGGPFQLERTTYLFVVEIATSKPWMVFSSEEDLGTYGSSDWSTAQHQHGVSDVVVAADGEHVLVAEGNEARCVPVTNEDAAEVRACYARFC